MNNLVLKGSLIMSLFSIFSISAMEVESPWVRVRPITNWFVSITNETNIPLTAYFNIMHAKSLPLWTSKEQVLDAGNSEKWPLSDKFRTLRYILAEEPSYVGTLYRYSPEPRRFGTVEFLVDKVKNSIQARFNIGSFNKKYDFDMADIIGNNSISALTILRDNPYKTEGNFENSTFALKNDFGETIHSKEMLEEGN